MTIHRLCPSYEHCRGRCPKHVHENTMQFNMLIVAQGYEWPGAAAADPLRDTPRQTSK